MAAILILGLILLMFIVLVIDHLRNKIKYQGVDQSCTLSVSESGIVAEFVTGRTQLPWSKIRKIHQTRNHILIYLSGRAAFVIPRRSFADHANAEQFFETSQRFWENSKNAGVLA